jgi:CRISPR/Cas system-associated exonuclease Cas4 (RecB family)
MTEDDALSRFVAYADLNSRAQLLRDEFEVMYDELRIIAKVDVRAGDESFEDEVWTRMLALKAALAKARDTVRAEDLALQAMFGNGQLEIKRSEAIKYWEPIILQLAADINACAMLRRSNSCKWFRDPSGAHEERYRNEMDWTSRVRDGGIESIDVQYRVKTHLMN